MSPVVACCLGLLFGLLPVLIEGLAGKLVLWALVVKVV